MANQGSPSGNDLKSFKVLERWLRILPPISLSPRLCVVETASIRSEPFQSSGESMASKLKIKVNGLVHNVTASLDTPLLYVLHNELHLHGPRFGCGLAIQKAAAVTAKGGKSP